MVKTSLPVCKRCKLIHPIYTGVALACKKSKGSITNTAKPGSLYFVQGGKKVSFQRKAKIYHNWEGAPIGTGFMLF